VQELVECPCCDKMVPANDMEISYRMPDVIASMEETEIENQCRYTNDYVVCNDEYFYIRCVIPLPVQEAARNYCIGAWAQVSQNSFNRIWELWDEDDQSSEPAIHGMLANDVHLNTNSENSKIEVQLMGAKSRPTITIKDSDCSLYKEQQSGITIHRASEYSDLCR
jgi:hypothetical protein